MRVWFLARATFLLRGTNITIKPLGDYPTMHVTHCFRVLPGDEVAAADVSKSALQEIRQKAEILGIEL